MNINHTRKKVVSLISLTIIFLLIIPTLGDASAQEPVPPAPWLIAFPENNAVEGWEWPDGATVSLRVNLSEDILAQGKAEVTTWGDPRTNVRLEFDGTYDLLVGDEVILTDDTMTVTHIVRNLSVTGVDQEENVVSGVADAGVTVQVWVHGADQSYLEALADAEGNWQADFDTVGFDLVEGMGGRSQILDNGSATAVDWNVPTPPPLPWRDDFDAAPAPPWIWLNENEDRWDLDEGFLRIYASSIPTPAENLLLRPVAEGDFAIETHVSFEPQANFHFAGIMIYQDEDNHLAFGRAFCDIPGACVGNGIYFDNVQGGEWTGENFHTLVDPLAEATLRLERKGEMVKGFYSGDRGISWVEIGTHWLPGDFQVNGVGLMAANDFGETGIPADFDYFELSEGWGFLPEGFHDFDQGDAPDWACNAGGWAVDPDDRSAHIPVEIVVDHQTIATPIANKNRPDLDEAGLCMGGNCGFFVSLWGLISAYQPHDVVAWAQDIQSGDWVRLSNSPKTLNCRTYDIYAHDPLTGETIQITDLREMDEYNPSWSPNGKLVVYDVVNPDDSSGGVYLTDLSNGATAPLVGAQDGGNDAVWSPNGKWIAFDRSGGGDYSLYLVPAAGGDRQFIRADAISGDWAPSGKRLVFQQPSDGSIRTVAVIGGKGAETLVAVEGANPSWSPDGNWIAYDYAGDIWKVAVNVQGKLLGDPVRLTQRSADEGQPTWSADSQTIIFHAGLSRDFDLWTIPAAGGAPTWLTGAPEFGDYDPAGAKNGATIAYASFSPEGQAARHWGASFTYDLPAGAWAEGEHSYFYQNTFSFPEAGDYLSQEVSFSADVNEPIFDRYVLLRPWAVRTLLDGNCLELSGIHPDQATRFQYGWVSDYPLTYADALAHFDSMSVTATWDGFSSAELVRQEIIPRTGEVDWLGYACSYAEPLARDVNIGNFSVAWSPYNPEEITSLRWNGSENLTNPWQQPACLTDIEYFGNSWVSENEGTDQFFFASLVGWSTAGTWLQDSTAVNINSISSGCPASAELPIRTTYQFFEDELRENLMRVQRVFEFGDTPFDHAVRPFIPRLYPANGFSQVIHPDASGTSLVTEGTCVFGCQAASWDGSWFAIHDPESGVGMIVQRESSLTSTALWLDDDGGSFTNASSFLLFQPAGGFTGTLIETEYLCFYDSSIWRPSLSLPAGCQP